MNASEKQAGSLTLMALSLMAALACVSAIGAATTLVVMAVGDSGPEISLAAHDADCAVVAWKSGATHCFRRIVASAQ